MGAVTHEFREGELISGTRYRVLRLIGEGGMGWIFDVEHVELEKRFVVKVLKPDCARRSDLVGRLRNEWRALGRLQHPNIVAATDAGDTADGVPFFVMERLDGEPLSRCLRRERRLSVPAALHIAAGVLDGLAAAHEIGIVHRDIKPPNIFLLKGGGIKLLDFGVAKVDNPRAKVITSRGIAIGTPRYMSPEQANGASLDGRADLYATGLILFEMIAGESPYENARDTNDLIIAHLAREAPRLSKLVPGIARELDDIVASLLAKDPRQRPSSACGVAVTLRQLAARARRGVSTDAPTVRYSAANGRMDPQAARELGVRGEENRAGGRHGPARDAETVGPPGRTDCKPTLRLGEADDSQLEQTTRPLQGAVQGLTRIDSLPDAHTEAASQTDLEGESGQDSYDSIDSYASTDHDQGAYSSDALGAFGEPSSPERTLRLSEPVQEQPWTENLTETHTAVPLDGPPLSETPPPVTPGVLAPATGPGRAFRLRVGALGATVAVCGALLGAWLALSGRTPPPAEQPPPAAAPELAGPQSAAGAPEPAAAQPQPTPPSPQAAPAPEQRPAPEAKAKEAGSGASAVSDTKAREPAQRAASGAKPGQAKAASKPRALLPAPTATTQPAAPAQPTAQLRSKRRLTLPASGL